MPVTTSIGRPLRTFRLLALGFGMLVMWRLPALQADLRTTRMALAGDAGLAFADAGRGPDRGRVQLAASHDPMLVGWRDFGGGMPLADYRLGPPLVLLAYPVPSAAGPAAPPLLPASFDIAGDWSLPAGRVAAPVPAASAAPGLATEGAGEASPGSPAGDYATSAYAALAAGNRRAAAGLFDLALAAGPDPRRKQWEADRRRLTRRWAGDFFSLLRDPGPPGAVGPAASPLLGGGQSGASLRYTFDPLARRPVALTARLNSATGGGNGTDPASTQAAVGVRWQPLPAVSLYAERLIAIGADARNDWQFRVAGGGGGRRGRIRWTGYGEAGVIASGDIFAGAQGFGGVPVFRVKGKDVLAGAGAWGSYQTGAPDASRLDLGPSVATQVPLGRWSLDMSADYRFRLAGNAQPGSGPALTIATSF